MNERVTPDRAVEEIYDRNGLTEAEAGDFVAEKKAEAEKLYTEASNEPVTRNTGEGLSEFAQRKAEHTARVEGLKRNLDKWNQIEAAAERRNMTKTGAELTAMDLDARERDIKRQTEERVDELAKKLGDVEKVYDISEVTNPEVLAELRAGRTIYGWYDKKKDKKKDKVVLYMPNITDPGEATRTIIHEQVIHRGLSKMFGEDYDNVLAEVYDKVMTPSEQQAFYEYVNGPKEGKAEDIRKKQLEAADEWIADNYQNLRFKQYNVWDKIVSSVRGILRKNGFDVDYTRRDIENLVRDSYRNLERSGAGEVPYASAEEGTMLMGSRVNKRMKEVGDIFADRELSDAERSVVDVYSGKADNQPITVTTADGQERRVVMRQGNESGAGTKHSLFRHYNTNSGAITAEDILRIPKIIAEGERKEEGRKVVYELEENGVRYKVLTEIDARREVFANFFTNRRASSAARKTRSEEARDTADDAQLADKVTANSSSDQKTGSDLTNVSENGTRFYKSNENQRIFVSNAEKAVEGIKQEKGTPEQWLKMIEKGGGLKAGEDKWMGLSDWLKEHKGKSITKQEVLDFIRENQIQIEEVKYGEANSNPAFASLKEEYDQWLREEGSDYAWKQLTDRYGDDADIAFWDLGGELAISNEEAAAALLGENVINSTRLEYTTEGLANNREIALTVPSIEPYNSHDEIHFGDADGGRAIAWVRFGETYSYPVIEHVQKVTDFHEPYKNINQMDVYKPVGGFASGDYVVHGKGRDGNMIYVAYINDKQLPVAHATLEEARNAMNEYYKEHPRKLRKAQRVLVIDEIQSKRHQDGRENGYQTEEFIQTEKRLRELESKPHRTEEENREYRELMNKMDGMLRENPHPVPDAPFAKNWHELAMKRMLKLAAEEGYDKIAWTKGAQQAERYNIGESVKNIEVNAVTDAETGEVLENEFDVYTRSNSNGGGFITEATGRMNTEQIHEIFGKDLGGRIIEGGRTQSNTIIEGDDLRIGGEGMKGFYDKMLPSFMNKYGKKWGTKVGEVELPDVEEAGRTMWSVDVTPEMKESVMQGQTMFSKKNAEREELRESEESKALFDYSKKRFGRTNDLSEAGYILPDGAMLDFSGRHEMSPGSDTSFLRGRRATDHRGIVDIEYDFDGNETDFTTDMGDFLNRGAIRIDGDSGAINLTMKPTPKQKDILRRLVQRMDGDVWVDFGNGWDTEHYAEYTGVKPARVLSDIDKYYDEGIKPEGQTMFSKKVSEFNAETGEEVRFRKREEPDPKKTQKVYKLMRLGEDGKLYPLYIDNASAVELGQWYNADSPNLGDLKKLPSGIHLIDSEGRATSWEDYKAANNLKGKKPNADVIRQTAENGSRWVSIVDKPTSQKRYEGENRSYYNLGINGSGQVGEFAMRPGWHAGSLPTMRQIGKGKNKDLRDDSFVWIEGEVSADKDYQQEAESNPDKDIPTHIPTDGYYLKATNANKKASQADRVGWYVAGAFKPNRIIGDSEARSIIDKWNAEHPSEPVEYDFPRESGKDFEPGDTRFSKAMETELDKAFNEKLSTLNDENKDKVVFDLGRPSKILLDAGVSDKPMKLYGNKVIKKQKKHGFDLSELKGLPSAIADPIAVFDNYNNDVTRSILTELHTEQGNVLAAVSVGKGMDIDVNIIRSVFGKGEENLFDWLKRGMATYINEKKTLDFLHHSDLLSEALKNQESSSDAAKLNKIGELNKLLGEKLYVRTKNFKDWFGDWEKKPEDASKAVGENGEPLMLWHETGNDFTVFNPRHEGAGTRDYLTPFGIFLKPSPSPIGVAREGEAKQMALYANIRNPIEFADRKELDDYLRSNCEGYARAADAIKDIDAEYGKRLDDAERIEDEAMTDIYRNHPEIWNDDAKRMEAYEKHSAESTRILEEWKGAVNRQSEALKEVTDKFFRNSGHDGIVLKNDEGSFGRKTKTYIAFNPNQVKSATGNVGTFSRENDDIRFSKKVYGGNSGYVGYSMSKRADEARKQGRFPKTDFKKEYGVTSKVLEALVKAKVISDNEWHHTSMYGNKTTFYEWGEKEYADFYAGNKKEIDDMARKGDIDGISARFKEYDEQLPELRKAEEERRKAKLDETLRLQKEYNEYLDDAVDIPSEYTAENGVRIETNGSRKPADWKYFWGDKPAFRNYASKAKEEFSKVVGDKMKDLPSFEEWRTKESPDTVAGSSRRFPMHSVVPDDSVAKLSNLSETYKKIPGNRTRGFITDLSKAIGAQKNDGASQYKTFNIGGKDITIRISNHNSNVETFDANNEAEGVSIVISGARNTGIKGAGSAHVVEFFYPKKSLERAEGKPLVQIIDSVKELLATGEYVDKTGLAIREEVNGKSEPVAGTESMRAIESSGTMFSVRPLLGDKNLHKGLRELKEGEKSHVERVFTENKNFEFSSMNKVESYSDIAYIFRQLEDEAIENSFAVLVKKGKPTVIHLGTGNYTATMVSNSALNVAVNRVNPDKIYFVHNHPSGKLKASRQDEDLLSNLKKMYGPKVADGIIINARSGRYGIYTPSSLHTGADYDVNHGLSDTSNARPIKVYSFSKQVFSPDYQPDALITSSDDVAKFVSSHRLGDRQKLGLIISNNKGAITGNIFLPYSEITNENARDIANDIAYYTSVVGGTRAFMFGNVPLRDVAYKGLSAYVKGFSDLHLLDYVEIDGGRHKSASDEGIRFRFVKTPEEFDSVQKEAVEKKGIVTPGLKDKVLNVVDVPKHDFTGSLKDARAEARKWAKDMYHGKVFDLPDDGGRYIISNTAIDKYLDATAITNSDNAGIHLSALKELPQIISQSIDAEVHPDYKKGENGVRSEENGVDNDGLLVHRMYGAINIDGETYRVKTTMHEFKDDNTQNTPHSYEVTKIELIESSSVTPYNNGIDRPLNVSTNSISAAKLLNGVEKAYDKGKKLLAESKTLTPVNKNAAFRKDYKAEKAQTEDRLLKKTARTFSEITEGAKFSVAQRIWNDKNEVYKDMREHIKKTSARTGWNQHEGVISYLKSQVGKTNEAMWQDVRNKIAEATGTEPTIVDVQMALWEEGRKGGGPMSHAERIAKRREIVGYISFDSML